MITMEEVAFTCWLSGMLDEDEEDDDEDEDEDDD